VSRGLRSAHGLAQEDWAAWLEVSRKSVQRWERGNAVPDDRVEAKLIEFCNTRDVWGLAVRGAIDIGIRTEADLRDVLARARHDRVSGPAAAPTDDAPFGRAADIDAIRHLTAANPVVTITGPGGVGKTTLALAAAPAAVVVRLDTISGAELVLNAIAAALDVRQYGGRSLRDAVVRAITEIDRLVLDNFEHVLAAAPLVADLVATCPRLRVLVTSRIPLRLEHETEYGLEPLAHDGADSAAVALFLARARAADPEFTPDASTLAVAERIAARLDGVPLALELAAARLRHVSLPDLAARIDHPPAILGVARNATTARHRTLTDALAWSTDLLEPSRRELFRCLAEFADGATLDAVEVVGGAHAVDDVGELLEQHLVFRAGRRYRMLQIVRDYAPLVVTDVTRDPAAVFLDWALAFARAQAAEVTGPGYRDAIDALADDYGNLRAALVRTIDAGDLDRALPLALAVCPFWDVRAMLQEARQFLEPLASMAGERTAGGSACVWIGYFAAHQGDLVTAARRGREALAIFETAAIDAGIGYARLVLGLVAAEDGRLDDAWDEWQASAAAFEASSDRWGLVRPLNNLGEVARARGALDEAAALHEQALALCRELGDGTTLPSILNNLAHVGLDRGDTEAGAAAAAEALAIATELDSPVARAFALDVSARAAFETSEVEAAVRLWARGHVIHERLGLPIEARDRARYDEQLAAAREQLGDERYAAIWNELA